MDSEKDSGYFWPSYVDLMISLFFVVMVLFVVSYSLYSKKLDEIEVKAKEAEKIEDIKNTLKYLMQDSTFFIYEKEYKRHRLATDVAFKEGKSNIRKEEILNYETTYSELLSTGAKLKEVLDSLVFKKENYKQFEDVSYVLVIGGRASRDTYRFNYELSYSRALSLYRFWKLHIADFDSKVYQKIIDLQISGVGTGGLGRFPPEFEEKNRCFFIQIIPKVGQF